MHGFTFSAWMVLLVVQTSLVAANRIDIHRRLGIAGGALAVLMMVLGACVAISRTASGQVLSPPGISPLAFLTVPLAAVVVFPVLLGSAMWFRNRPDVHKRLVLIATLELVMAAVGRLPCPGSPRIRSLLCAACRSRLGRQAAITRKIVDSHRA